MKRETLKDGIDFFSSSTSQCTINAGRPSIGDNVFIIDTSWMSYKYQFVMKDLCITVNGESYPTGVMTGLCKLLQSIKGFDSRATVIFALDSHPDDNKELVEGYKDGRDNSHLRIHEQLRFCIPYFSALNNVYFVKYDGIEADDLLGAVPYTFKKWDVLSTTKWYLMTNDLDAYQALEEDVLICSGMRDRKPLNVKWWEDCEKRFGVGPVYMPLYKAVLGKASDSMKPLIPRFPKKLLMDLCAGHDGSIDSFISICKDVVQGQQCKKSQLRYVQGLLDQEALLRDRYKLSKHNLFDIDLNRGIVNKQMLSMFASYFRLSTFAKLIEGNV